MSIEENKALVRRFYQEICNQHHLASFDQMVAADFVDHALPPGLPPGAAGTRQFFAMHLTAFPDVRVTVEDLVAEGDRVVARLSYTGTHHGHYVGVPPTGRPVTVTAIDILRVAGGKLVEHWGHVDQMGLMQQLGALSTPG